MEGGHGAVSQTGESPGIMEGQRPDVAATRVTATRPVRQFAYRRIVRRILGDRSGIWEDSRRLPAKSGKFSPVTSRGIGVWNRVWKRLPRPFPIM